MAFSKFVDPKLVQPAVPLTNTPNSIDSAKEGSHARRE